MKAIVLDDEPGLENLRIVERPRPQPQRQQVLIRVKATALNYRDLEIVRGSYHTSFKLPLIPLSDGVGRSLPLATRSRA